MRGPARRLARVGGDDGGVIGTPGPELRAGVIGLGVGVRHIAGYHADARCRVVALCDVDPERLEDVGRRHPECRLTTDASELLADPEIDVVSVATYETYHCEQVVAAIASGKHVFVEKPLCLHDDELDRIDAALLERPDIRLGSNLALRRHPQFLEVKRRIDAGRFGRLFYLEGDYNYGRIEKITNGWRGRIPFYSVTHGGGIHMIDLLLWLSGSRATEGIAIGNQIATEGTQFGFPDMVTALLRFEDGMTAKVSANFGCVAPHHHALEVFGTRATFVHDHRGGVFYHDRDPGVPGEPMRLDYPREEKGNVLRSFLRQILDGEPADVSASEVLDAMAVSLALERSLRSRAWEPVRYARSSTTGGAA